MSPILGVALARCSASEGSNEGPAGTGVRLAAPAESLGPPTPITLLPPDRGPGTYWTVVAGDTPGALSVSPPEGECSKKIEFSFVPRYLVIPSHQAQPRPVPGLSRVRGDGPPYSNPTEPGGAHGRRRERCRRAKPQEMVASLRPQGPATICHHGGCPPPCLFRSHLRLSAGRPLNDPEPQSRVSASLE